MNPILRLAMAGLLLSLGACADPITPAAGAGGGGSVPGALPNADQLCASSACGAAEIVIAIPDAENILFSDDGRLFVTGGLNAYEITKAADGTFSAAPMFGEDCGFTGMAILNGYLYANGCDDHSLLAAPLSQHPPQLQKIYQYTGFCIPNGMATGPDGRLYTVDEPLPVAPVPECAFVDPKIAQITLTDPTHVASQTTWLQGSESGLLWLMGDDVLRFPNGLVRDGNTFYGTDGGAVYSIPIADDGTAGEVQLLFWEPTAHDDIGICGDCLLVADFFKGRFALLSREGELLQETDPFTFTAVSSVRLGRPPMFAPTDILVTDKGVIGDNDLPIDYLMVFRANP